VVNVFLDRFLTQVFTINHEYYDSLQCVFLPQDDTINDIEPYMMLKHAVISLLLITIH